MTTNAYPYFRFTSFWESPGVLEPWFAHFERLGVPCALVRHSENRHFKGAAYSIWRIGQEHLSGDTRIIPNNEGFSGEILKECHEFSEKMRAA